MTPKPLKINKIHSKTIKKHEKPLQNHSRSCQNLSKTSQNPRFGGQVLGIRYLFSCTKIRAQKVNYGHSGAVQKGKREKKQASTGPGETSRESRGMS